MQQQERDLISGLFDRLKPFETQPRDREAEQFINGFATQQPAAPYLLVQTVLVQEQALKAAQERIAELEAKTEAAPATRARLPGKRTADRPVGRVRRHSRTTDVGAVHGPAHALAPAGRPGPATAAAATGGGRGQLPADRDDDGCRRRRRRAAVRGDSRSDGQQPRPVRPAGRRGHRSGQGAGRRERRRPNCCRPTRRSNNSSNRLSPTDLRRRKTTTPRRSTMAAAQGTTTAGPDAQAD